MKILLTGGSGQLGYDVRKELIKRGHSVMAPSSAQMDITDINSVRSAFKSFDPDAVIHCAAYTAVDKAEEEMSLCRKINAFGTKNIALLCKEFDCKLIYISTDYIFDGSGDKPWEPEDETRGPLNVYGLTKYEGELFVSALLSKYYIVRISWVFGLNGSNFVKTMLRLGKEGRNLSVVNDQFGSPTYTKDLAVLLSDMAEREEYGIYHASNENFITWYEFACGIFSLAGMKEVKVTPVESSAFKTMAKRPKNSRMSKEKLTEHGFCRLPSWEDAVKRYLTELKENEHGKN